MTWPKHPVESKREMASIVWHVDTGRPPRIQSMAQRRLSQPGVAKPRVAAALDHIFIQSDEAVLEVILFAKTSGAIAQTTRMQIEEKIFIFFFPSALLLPSNCLKVT